jgi:hypothetical protein
MLPADDESSTNKAKAMVKFDGKVKKKFEQI